MAPLLEKEAAPYLGDLDQIPQLTYSLYAVAERTNPRLVHKPVVVEKRTKMTVAALQLLLGSDEYKNALYDYIWSTCEESTWVPPQHLPRSIDLFAAGVGFDLAEIVVGLEHKLEDKLITRVREEIDRRIFAPYLEGHDELSWYRGHNNWNGVCNGAVGSMFLLLEPDRKRLARALEIVLEGLEVFLDTAFEADGASAEGVSYWQYGLSNLVCFAELLRRRTSGAVDILGEERLREIAQYPLRMMLCPGHYFSFSDSRELHSFQPYLISRLAERTGVGELYSTLAEPAPIGVDVQHFHVAWRNLLWWDGERAAQARIDNAWLETAGVTRLVSATPSGAPVVLAAKASHNGVSHNHNDVGTFVLNVDGETFLCDPEGGLYDLYRRLGHDANIFANSFGHSIPVIGGMLQSRGQPFHGEVTLFAPVGSEKRVEMEIQSAYQCSDLERATRSWRLMEAGGLVLEDTFVFSGEALPVEEAFVTWRDALVSGGTALIVGENHILQLTIEEPVGAAFALASLEKESAENQKPQPLKRISFAVPPAGVTSRARVRAVILPQ
jgi:hypothetical protein